MLRWRASLLAILAVSVVTAAAAEAEIRLEHAPPPTAAQGRPLPLDVLATEVDGTPATTPLKVFVFHRQPGQRDWVMTPLARRGASRHAGTLPAVATRGAELLYHFQARFGDGRPAASLGSPVRPLRVETSVVTSAATHWLWHAFVLVLLVLTAAAVVATRSALQGARRHEEHRFWQRILDPLSRLSKLEQGEWVERLSQTELKHPLLGPRRFDKKEIVRRLRAYQASQPPPAPGPTRPRPSGETVAAAAEALVRQ